MLAKEVEVKGLVEHLLCPILQEMMQDPVIAADGHTYERQAIEAWINSRGARAISPMTGERLLHLEVQPNYLAKKMIEEYKSKVPEKKQRKLEQKDIELAMRLRQEELEGVLAKQQGVLKTLEQERNEVLSKMGPLAQENYRLKAEVNQLRQEVKKGSEVNKTALPLEGNNAVKENRYTPQLVELSALENTREKLMEDYSANVIKRALANKGIYRQLKKTHLLKRQEDLSHEIEVLNEEQQQKLKQAQQKTQHELQQVETDYLAKAEVIRNAIKAANDTDDDSKITELTAQRMQLRKEYENHREVIKKQLAETIAGYEQSHAKLVDEKKLQLNQVKLAKESKAQALDKRSIKIQGLTEVMEREKQSLLVNMEQQQQQVATLSSKASQMADRLNQRLNSPVSVKKEKEKKLKEKQAIESRTDSRAEAKARAIAAEEARERARREAEAREMAEIEARLKSEAEQKVKESNDINPAKVPLSLFKPTAAQNLSLSSSIVEVNPAEVTALLKYVTECDLAEAEKLLQKNPKLALAQGTIKDLSDRIFENITAFQLAVWYLDNEMWEVILKYLDKSAAAMQFNALLNDRKDIHAKHGKHFAFDPLLAAYDTYLKNFYSWSLNQCKEHWCKRVGGEQRKMPAWYIKVFSEQGRNARWVRKDFTRIVTGTWFNELLREYVQTASGNLGCDFAWWRCERGSAEWSSLYGSRFNVCGCGEASPWDRDCAQFLRSRQHEQLGKLQAMLQGQENVSKLSSGGLTKVASHDDLAWF